MKNKFKSALIPLMLLVTVLLLCACGADSQFDKNDAAGYTVSVKFDANGGEFTTNCSEIVDSFNISGLQADDEGNVKLALIAPDNSIRGANDTYTVLRNGYFLAGWYESRTETVDENGNTVYVYEGRWDFDTDKLTVNAGQQYTSSEPQLTLYAAWVPMYEIQYFNLGTEEAPLATPTQMDTVPFNPTSVGANAVPRWNSETGEMDMFKFPKLSGHTFVNAYYDAEKTQQLGMTLKLPAFEATEKLVAEKTVINVYVEWKTGEWYRIYTAEQFSKIKNRTGCYELCADLDFTDVDWPFVYGEFSGKIIGNNHTISNVTITQDKNDKTRFGLFGSLAEGAELNDVTFRNVTATISAGVRVSGASYGLFAGAISNGAVLNNVSLQDSLMLINPECNLSSTDYVIGMICGMGDMNRIQIENVQVQELKPEVGEGEEIPADRLIIEVDENGILTIQKP